MKTTDTQNELHTLYLKGLDLFSAGDIPAAKTVGQNLISQNQAYAPGWFLLGQACFANNEITQAFDFLANAINLDRNNHDYLIGIAECLIRLGDLAKGIGFADQALKINPESKQALLLLGQASMQANNTREAYRYYLSYIELDDQNAVIFNNIGCIALMLDETSQATNFFAQAIKINPNFADPYNNLGVIASKQQDLKLAIKMYKKAIKHNPKHLDAHINLGSSHYNQNEIKDAIACLDTALQIDANNLNANTILGKIFASQREHSRAIYYLTKAHQINAHVPEVIMQLAISMYTLREYIGAKNYLLQLLQHNRNNPQALYYLGLVCMELCSYSDANKFFIDARVISSDNIKILNSLAESYIILKQLDKADEILNECYKLSVENPYTDLLSALIKVQKCDFQNTIKHATKLVIDSEKYWNNPDAKVMSPYYIKFLHLSPELHEQYLKHYELNLQNYNQMIAEFKYHDITQTKNLQIHVGYLIPIAPDYPLFDNIIKITQSHDNSKIQIFIYRLDQLLKYSDREIALKINNDQIDVLIDLCGYDSLFSRPGILALKPALFQRSWLTSDYSSHNNFIEPLKNVKIRVPFCHVVKQDSNKHSYDLPEDEFIYCGFTSAEYLDKNILECWLNILQETTGTVLWLSRLTSDAQNIILQLANNKNIDSNRIIFTGPDKMFSGGPHNLANVALDILPSKSNNRAFIAIQDEVPIITFMHFPEEILNEFHAENMIHYTNKAIQLAKNKKLSAIPLRDKSSYFNARDICAEIEMEVRRLILELALSRS